MSSDLYAFDTTLYSHSNSDLVSSDGVRDLPLISESFPFFANSQENCNNNALSNALDPFSPSFFSFSPPSSHLESLSLYHANRLQSLSNGQNLANEFGSFSAFDGSEMKTEECQMGGDYAYSQQLPLCFRIDDHLISKLFLSFSTPHFSPPLTTSKSQRSWEPKINNIMK